MAERSDAGAQVARAVLVVVGPSGAGKSSLVGELARRGLVRVHPTWTTRPPRPAEADDCLEHRFVDDTTFDGLERDGFFLETVTMFGLPHRYGLPPVQARDTGPVDTVMLRAPLVERFARYVARFVVYQVEDTPERARPRLESRGTSPADVAARVATHDAEVRLGRGVADRVFVNDDTLGRLADRVTEALAADGLARTREEVSS